MKEAQRVGTVNIAASTESENFARIPRQDELKLTPNAAYVHMTTNNTLFGTEWTKEPAVGDVPLVADTSSDMFSRPIDVSKYGLIYAGAQKNLGPSGVTLVIIREDLLARSSKSLHTMLNYAVHAENGSMYNTPPCFGIYLMGLVMKWALAEGGLEAIGKHNERKAAKLYAEIDRTGFYRGTAEKASRSRMNITFRLPSEELESGVREAVDRRGSRRPQGPSFGRRHARVDLQRVPGGRRRRAGLVHAGVREEERLEQDSAESGISDSGGRL